MPRWPGLSTLLLAVGGWPVWSGGDPLPRPAQGIAVGLLAQGSDLTVVEGFQQIISNPAIVALLLTFGLIGLITEIRSPGFGVPGIVGAISLVLAFYGLGQIEANFAGLVLVGVALALFIAEAFTPAFGVLAVGGTVAFVLGMFFLFDSSTAEVPWTTIVLAGAALAAFTIFAGVKGLRAQRRPALTGDQALIGHTARVKTPFAAGEPGSVFTEGEWWTAELASGRVEAGEEVIITGRRGYTLFVRRQEPKPAPEDSH